MRIVYRNPTDIVNFDLDRFYKSLNKYGAVSKDDISKALEGLSYDPMHVSVLIEIGASLIPDDNKAKEYYESHIHEYVGFERLRRITGYLVGSLERWNDGKKAEERERVKHGVYAQENKDWIEAEKAKKAQDNQNEYHKEEND